LIVGIGIALSLPNHAAPQQNETKGKTMFSAAMRAFDRASLTLFIVLGALPMLAVAVNASIH
jgi:hypothetical protein